MFWVSLILIIKPYLPRHSFTLQNSRSEMFSNTCFFKRVQNPKIVTTIMSFLKLSRNKKENKLVEQVFLQKKLCRNNACLIYQTRMLLFLKKTLESWTYQLSWIVSALYKIYFLILILSKNQKLSAITASIFHHCMFSFFC